MTFAGFFRKAALLGAAGTVALASGPAFASHSWGGYHWARTSTSSLIYLDVGDNVSSAWDNVLVTAIADWNPSSLNTSPVFQLALKPGLTSPRTCKPVAGTVQVCSASYGYTGWLGIAQIWLSGGHITQGVTKLNDSYFNSPTYDTEAWRLLVSCQEVGHDFGLAHQDEDFYNPNLGTCMDYTNDPDGTLANPDQADNRYPNAHDYEELGIIYNHADTPSGGGGGGHGRGHYGVGEDAGGNSPAEWGKAIHFNGDGKPDEFVQDLGGGRKKLTHVFWTPNRVRKEK